MRKKFIVLLILIILSSITSGCIRVHTNISINEDGSGTWEHIIAMSGDLFEMNQVQEDDPFEELRYEAEMEGFKVENYQEDSYTGIRIIQEFSNINNISTGNFINSLEEDVLSQEELATLFEPNIEISENFLFSTYTIKMDLDQSEVSSENMDDFPFDNMFDNVFDLKFNVSLPIKATKHNAISESDNGKSLSWDIASEQVDEIYLEFRIINSKNLFLTVWICSIIFILLLLIISRKKRRRTVHY
ncbi:LppM family (lipo)protein [Natronospora cellulosivora (SeqCode)]